MLKEKDRQEIIEITKRYGARHVLLFGSSLRSDSPRDIDLAVEGLEPSSFFKYYGELMWRLSLPVDLVDLSERSRFTELIREEGIALYESA